MNIFPRHLAGHVFKSRARLGLRAADEVFNSFARLGLCLFKSFARLGLCLFENWGRLGFHSFSNFVTDKEIIGIFSAFDLLIQNLEEYEELFLQVFVVFEPVHDVLFENRACLECLSLPVTFTFERLFDVLESLKERSYQVL